MNKIMKQMSLASLLVTCAMSGVHAAPVSAIATDTQDLVISSTDTASISITPVTGLMAQYYTSGTKVADVAVSATNGTVAFRWTPTSGVVDSKGNRITVAGKSTGETHDVWFAEQIRYGASANLTKSASNPEWWYADGVKSFTTNVTLASNQTLSADSYPLSMDAAIWVE